MADMAPTASGSAEHALFPGCNDECVEVKDFFKVDGAALIPVTASPPKVRSPADDGIAASVGDDLTAPNATTAARLNRIVCAMSTSVGYSKAAKDRKVPPSGVAYDIDVAEGRLGYAMTLRITLEYSSAFPDQGMVVWMKKQQQFINDDKLAEVLLIDTAFEDWVDGHWVPISTDIRYADEAEALVQTVITSDAGQTAGRMKTEGAIEDAKLGPVGERGRIVLTYFCDQLYSYTEMCLGNQVQPRTLVPLALQLPWSTFDSPAAACRIRACVRGPAAATVLDPVVNILAYRDLQQSLVAGAGTNAKQAVVVPEFSSLGGAWEFTRDTLPPVPTMVLVWMSVPDADDGWEHVASSLPSVAHATLLHAHDEDAVLLRAALPGGQTGQLIRCNIDTVAPDRHPDIVRVHTDIVISDASGSTGMRIGGLQAGTVRAAFNKHEERRVLKRFQAIPQLQHSRVLLPHDIWRQHFVIFDHGVRAEFGLESVVGDLDSDTVAALIQALTGQTAEANAAASALGQQGKTDLLYSWKGVLDTLRSLTPGGATSFVAGLQKATEGYAASSFADKTRINLEGKMIERTSYVNFDTDGGNNCGPCYDGVRELLARADVVQGHVLGVGSWVDQDCASRVALILKGSASLAVSFPEDAAADMLFRQDLSRWVKVLRTTPISVSVSAGAVGWEARHGERSDNAVECLFARAEGVRFDVPDVSEVTYTKAQLKGLRSGESAVVYLLSRLPLCQLAQRLSVQIASVNAVVGLSAEPMRGVALGHHWLSVLGGASSECLASNSSVLCSRLRQRLEDDLSFAWNLPSKSGSTAVVGRARTQHRLPVSDAQQPEEPELPAPRLWGSPGSGAAAERSSGGLFGGGMGFSFAAPHVMCATAAAPAGSGGILLGSATVANGMFGGGLAQLAARGGGRGRMERAGGCKGRGKGGSMRDAMPGDIGGSWGAGAATVRGKGAPPPRPKAATKGKNQKKSCNKGYGLFGGTDDEHMEQSGPLVPQAILQASSFMCFGHDSDGAAVTKAVGRLKHTARNADGASGNLAEDPFVSQMLGVAPTVGWTHAGFVCDHCQVNPIVGARFKAASKPDHDVCSSCRFAGNYAGGLGFVPLVDTAAALRTGLRAILDWWPLVWQKHAELFSKENPDIMTLALEALRRAVLNLPE